MKAKTEIGPEKDWKRESQRERDEDKMTGSERLSNYQAKK